MFSYRHAFHAGNHGDVLKHVVLLQLLDHLALKDAAFWVIDTHAGAGVYALNGPQASKRHEFDDGIGRIFQRKDAPPAVAEYLDLVRQSNEDGDLRRYPGSPFIALQRMRAQDRLRLFEAHVNESRILAANLEQLGRDAIRRTVARAGDGFDGLKAWLPPAPRRGLVLIDPSYEDKEDYQRVVTTLKDALTRFATGCYLVWYPMVQRRESRDLPARLSRMPGVRWLQLSLTVRQPSSDGLGLHGSGLFVVNPPWTLRESMQSALPWLAKALGENDAGDWMIGSDEGARSRRRSADA